MGAVAVLGEQVLVQGFALAGAIVVPAETAAEVRAAWQQLPRHVVVAVLTPAAAAALGPALGDAGPLTVVMPV